MRGRAGRLLRASLLLLLVVSAAAFASFDEAYRRAVPAWWPRREPWKALNVDAPDAR